MSSQAKMRYNSLFTQTMQMQVPLNTTLHAGDIISCKFPKIQDGDATSVLIRSKLVDYI